MFGRRSSSLFVLAIVASSVALVVTGSGEPARPAEASAGAPDGFVVPIEPRRVYDSRDGSSALASSSAGTARSVDVFGPLSAGADVIAVFANVTITGPSSDGYLATNPTGRERASASTVNFARGETVANATVLARGSSDLVDFVVTTPGTAGSAHLIVDVFALITSDPSGAGRIVTHDPGRVFDSRTTTSFGSAEARSVPIVNVPLSGSTTRVPDDGSVVAVAVNITAVNDLPGSRDTWIGTSRGTSVLNAAAGDIASNFALVPLRDDGTIELFNASGSTHVIVDVWGHVTRSGVAPGAPGRLVILDVPFRAVDSRPTKLGPGRAEPWDFADFETSLAGGRVGFGSAGAIVGNLTATGLSRRYAGLPVSTYLTVHPTGSMRPMTSNLNLDERQTRATLGIFRLGGDSLTVYNDDGSVDYLIDVVAVVAD